MKIGTKGEDIKAGGWSWRFWTTLPLIVLAVALAATNGHFNILDDEVVILEAARQPMLETVRPFLAGIGEHEHPPLSDLLVHLWLKIVPDSPFWLRLPFIACYVGGFVILVMLARRLAGPATAVALAWIALLSPYGFHFGRLLGWFNFMFLLVSVLSYCYIRWLESNSRGWLAAVLVTATALLYTNYFSWVIVGLLALDAAIFRKPRRWTRWAEAGGALLLLAVLFAPLWSSFIHLAQHPNIQVQGSRLAAYVFDMYALLVSESFAPWFFAVGVPVALLCALCFALTLLGTRGVVQRFFVYFLILSGTLAAIGSINTKRLPFLLAWLFLPLAVAVTSDRLLLKRLLTISIAIVFAVGWFGTVTTCYYASTHFIDDWKDAVMLGMREHASGGALVFDNPVAGYYLRQACTRSGGDPALQAEPTCGISEARQWFADGHPGTRVVALRGVVYGMKQDPGDAYLDQHCLLESERHYTRDNGVAAKRRLFPNQREREWRVAVDLYQCS